MLWRTDAVIVLGTEICARDISLAVGMVREMRTRVPLLFPRDMLDNGQSVVEKLKRTDDNFGKERSRLLTTICGKS